MGVFFPGDVQHRPRPPRQHDTVNVDLVLNRVLQGVERFLRGVRLHGRKGGLGLCHVCCAGRGLERIAAELHGRVWHRVQHFVLRPAVRLHPIAVAVKHLQHRQGTFGFRQFLRHLQGRWQGHECVVAGVILAAEGPGIRQRPGSNKSTEFDALVQSCHQCRQQFVNRRVLHQAHERFEFVERQSRHVVGKRIGEAKVEGNAGADASDQHATANIRKEFTARSRCHNHSPGGVGQHHCRTIPPQGKLN